MSVLINAYSTLRTLPPLTFEHEPIGQRDRSDPELLEHLNGFAGYVMQPGEKDENPRQLSRVRYYIMRHIERVQHHLSLDVQDDCLDAFAEWAWEANAIIFLPDGSVRDPSGRMLYAPNRAEPEDEAQLPYPPDSWERKASTDEQLEQLGMPTLAGLMPVVSEYEVILRNSADVARRALALCTVALRAECLAMDQPLDLTKLRNSLSLGFESLSPNEEEFWNAKSPEKQDVVNFAWRYEALYLLEWSLGLTDELPFPSKICDVPETVRILTMQDQHGLVSQAELRPAEEILDTLDLHFRLHWITRQAQIAKQEPPGGLDAGVIQERHHALNWLVQFEGAEWDQVDTPT